MPAIIRIYVECAKLYGDVSEVDLFKIHVMTGKLTLHYYTDFEHADLPELEKRVK